MRKGAVWRKTWTDSYRACGPPHTRGLGGVGCRVDLLLLNLMMLRDEMLDGECPVPNRHLIMVFTVV
jgi:hypothetical protein